MMYKTGALFLVLHAEPRSTAESVGSGEKDWRACDTHRAGKKESYGYYPTSFMRKPEIGSFLNSHLKIGWYWIDPDL